MRPTLRLSLSLLFVVSLSDIATARKMMMRSGSIPDDLREVAPGSSAGPLRDLAHFSHAPWLTGSSIALLPGEDKLVIADTDNRSVVVVDAMTQVVHHRIAVGRRPERLVVAPSGLVYVTNRGSRSVSVVDPVHGVERRAVSAGVEPYGIALSPDASLLLVTASASGEVIAFDARTLAPRFTIETATAWPAAVAFHPDGKRAFVTHFYGGKVDVLDVERQRVVQSLELPTKDSGLPGRLLGRFDAPRKPNLAFAAVVSKGGTRLHVAHTMANTGEARAAHAARGGYGLGAPAPLVATVSTFDLETGKLMRPAVNFRGRHHSNAGIADAQVQMMSQPIALALDPRKARLFMVGLGCDRVMGLDAAASDPITRPLQVVQVGQAPKGMVFTADGTRAFVHNSQTYSVSVVDMDAPELQQIQQWGARPKAAFEFARSPLPEDVARGRRIFTYALDHRTSGGNRFACASCHPDGRQDNLVWQVSVGPRQTPILADKLAGTGPFNWLGSEDRLEDNIKQTVKRLGGSALKEAEVRDLAKYMRHYMPSLDNPYRAQNQRDVVAGEALFNDPEVGCSGCHTGRHLTDGSLHEVGTTSPVEVQLWKRFGRAGKRPGGPPSLSPPIKAGGQLHHPQVPREPPAQAPVAYNTPSLRHLWASAPYYHDGSASDLRTLLTAGNRGDRMGKTSHLSSRQLDQLVAYLKSL